MISLSGVRPVRESELPFLWDMLYEAAAVRAMGKEKALSLSSIKKYLEDLISGHILELSRRDI